MSKTLYINKNTALINFNQGFPYHSVDIINSEAFRELLNHYYRDSNYHKQELLNQYFQNDPVDEIIDLTRLLHVYEIEDINHPAIKDIDFIKDLIEDVYQYWRMLQRCSVMHLGKKTKTPLTNFIDKDTEFNKQILRFYRNLQEKAQGRKNKIYRQIQAGSNAAFTVVEKKNLIPKTYQTYQNLLYIDSILLHSPLILHPKTNKREGHFEEVYHNPIKDEFLPKEDFYCYPAKVGPLLTYVYFHKDFVFSALSLANLFELATTDDIQSKQPDIMIVFGLKDGKDELVYYDDKENNMIIGKISYQDKIEYFGYMKKMMLTCFNISMMNQNKLPIHGAMVNVYLKNKEKYGLIFMGDSGAGKSEIIEEITNIASDQISHMEVIFDDMGTLLTENGKVYAQGSEVGAFVRLDDLDRGLPYQTMDRSIFMNPESNTNARVIIPITPYRTIIQKHSVDFFIYANNFDDKIGLHFFNSDKEAINIFKEGKRMAKATTHETGITQSYFANPFGPLQRQDQCDPLIDYYFNLMKQNNIPLGEVYTNLGVPGQDGSQLKLSAQAVLDVLLKKKVVD